MRAWITDAALAGIDEEMALYPDQETGGLLLGYWGGDEVVITTVTGPGPAARRGRTWFEPDSAWQADQLAQVYRESGRTVTYLGDWHTHPGGAAVPSRRDRKTLRRIRSAPEARAPRPLMGIVVPSGGPQPALWCLSRRRRPVLLPLREC